MWTACLVVSMAIAALGVVLAIGVKQRHKAIKVLYILIGGVAASAFVMFFPIHAVQSGLTFGGIVRALALSLFNTIQIFAAGAEFGIVTEGTAVLSKALLQWHCIWASLLYVMAPCFTFGVVLSLFKNAWSYLRYYTVGRFREIYVFTNINDRSLTLAEDIRRGHKNSTIVFTNAGDFDTDEGYEQEERVKAIHAICFKKDVAAIRFHRHSARKPLYFFAIDDKESETLDQAVMLIEQYRDRENTHLYVFSTGVESELVLAAADKGVMRVRRVNEVRSLVDRLLYDEGEKLFETALPTDDGTKRICAMIVGMGGHGTEMTKALAWFGQMDGYRIEIHGFDRDPLAKDRFTIKAPELMSPKYNGVQLEGEAQYTIAIHAGMDVDSVAFAQAVQAFSHTTYVLVSLGSDERNIQTAIYLRMLFERLHVHPVIDAIVQNSQQKEALDGICNYRGQAYDIRFIGDLKSSFSEKVILHSKLEEEALARHLKWGREDEFWAYEYNYRSSTASAIHRKARIACGILGAEKAEEDLTEEEQLTIEVLEHRRWNAYMRAEGYVFSGSKDKASRNDLGKMHHDLVDYASLSEEEKRKDSAVGTE